MMYASRDRHGHKETTITSTYSLATREPCHGGIVRLSVLRIASATVLDEQTSLNRLVWRL